MHMLLDIDKYERWYGSVRPVPSSEGKFKVELQEGGVEKAQLFRIVSRYLR